MEPEETTSTDQTEGIQTPPAPELPAAPLVLDRFVWGTGRRKSSVARVRVKSGTGTIMVNGRECRVYFPTQQAQLTVIGPLRATSTADKFDVFVSVSGGGITGQAGAVALGIGRALKAIEPGFEAALRENGHLTRDSRMKERKKYGLRGARRAFQFSKR